MAEASPRAGAPDGELPGAPHGENLSLAFGQNATAGGYVDDNGGSGYPVAAYRSLVVVVRNQGAFDIVVTPRWTFSDFSALGYTEDSKTVPAGTNRRLIFQNQGDKLAQVKLTGNGGTSLMSYYTVGSNLDPLASNAPEYLILYGAGQTVTRPFVGDADHGKFQPVGYATSDASLWSFVLDGSGNIKEVHTSTPGRIECGLNFLWHVPVASSTLVTNINIFGAGPLLMTSAWELTTANETQDYIEAFTALASGTAQFSIDVAITTGDASLGWAGTYWWFKLWKT